VSINIDDSCEIEFSLKIGITGELEADVDSSYQGSSTTAQRRMVDA
jgi:hypothetical protein